MALEAVRILALPLELARLGAEHECGLGRRDRTRVRVRALSVGASERELAQRRVRRLGEHGSGFR